MSVDKKMIIPAALMIAQIALPADGACLLSRWKQRRIELRALCE